MFRIIFILLKIISRSPEWTVINVLLHPSLALFGTLNFTTSKSDDLYFYYDHYIDIACCLVKKVTLNRIPLETKIESDDFKYVSLDLVRTRETQ